MGLFDNLENKLSSMVNGAFAKAFKSSVQPVEIASAIRTAMDDKAAVVGRGRTIVPNLYTVQLSSADYAELSSYAEGLTDELVAAAEEHAESQRYHPAGPLRVVLSQDPQLETGVFKLRPASAKDPFTRDEPAADPYEAPRRDPYDAPRRDHYDVPAYDEPASRPTPPRHEAPPAAAADPYAPPAPTGREAAYRGGGRERESAYTAGAAIIPSGVGDRLTGDDFEAVDPYAPSPYSARDPLERDVYEPAPATHSYPPARRPRLDPTKRPWLDIDGDRYPLLGAITVIGRDGIADVVLDDPGISRRHAEIRVTSEGPRFVGAIRDLGSTNGTFVEGHRVASQALSDGDRVTVGRTSFTFRLGKP
ncbi:FhaA domain-containing protein [Arsenicicoccus dermatophilus]|uniref:FhaA domain-containing protein n=1 Tax=Arsenicicoccus dermatophilus TaxID=1076331 RepID=UPI00391702EE